MILILTERRANVSSLIVEASESLATRMPEWYYLVDDEEEYCDRDEDVSNDSSTLPDGVLSSYVGKDGQLWYIINGETDLEHVKAKYYEIAKSRL